MIKLGRQFHAYTNHSVKLKVACGCKLMFQLVVAVAYMYLGEGRVLKAHRNNNEKGGANYPLGRFICIEIVNTNKPPQKDASFYRTTQSAPIVHY